MRYELWIGLRYLVAKRREKFISIISFISVLGVAVGVMALIVVLAVMSGFDKELRDKIIGANAHILIVAEEGISDAESVIEKVEKVEGVTACSPFIDGQAMVRYEDKVIGVVLRGIDPVREPEVTKIRQYVSAGNLDFETKGIIIGDELSKRLEVSIGDSLSLISPASIRAHEFEVRGLFNSGMYQYDSSLVFLSLKDAQNFFNLSGMVSGIEVKTDDVTLAAKVAKNIQKELGYSYVVRSWMDVDRNLFNALKVEKKVMFIILVLIILVAAFNIASTLIMVVMEKTKDIGILKSMGVKNASIMGIFLFEGVAVGVIGALLGMIGGLTLVSSLNPLADFVASVTGFELFPQDIYYLERIPTDIQFADVCSIGSWAIILSLLAAVYPAWQARKLNPVEALRYE